MKHDDTEQIESRPCIKDLVMNAKQDFYDSFNKQLEIHGLTIDDLSIDELNEAR